MIAAIILSIHVFAVLYAFVKYKKGGTSEGLLAVGFMTIVFSVGWTVATMLTNLLFSPDFFVKWYYRPLSSFFWQIVRKELSRDTISLLLLTLGEWGFYYLYLISEGESLRQKSPPA